MRRLESKLTGMIYLNNAAAGWPKAPGVAEAVRLALEPPPTMPGRENSASQALVGLRGVRVYGRDSACKTIPVVSFCVQGIPVEECGDDYGEFVVTRATC